MNPKFARRRQAAPTGVLPVTAMDVAQRAGVSQSAVSRAFTPNASVAVETRKRVLAAAGELGYRPNLVARSLSTRRTNVIAVAISRLSNHFHAELLQALSARLVVMGYRVLLFLTDPESDADPILEEVLQHRVDAIALASISLSSHFAEECRNAAVPVVLLNRTSRSSAASAVTGDNYHGGQTIASFLFAAGHARYGYIAGSKQSSTSRDRELGFARTLRELGVPAPVRAVGNYSYEGAAEAARQLLTLPRPPDALFCANDHMAIATMDVATQEFGRRPGEDLSIVGFDDSEPAGYSCIGLTTFSQSPKRMAHQAAAMLEDMLSLSDRTPLRQVIGGELIVRRTARIPKAGIVEADGKRIWRLPDQNDESSGGPV
jgi:DNA-binding LacI/PurR family transcriptional regulator